MCLRRGRISGGKYLGALSDEEDDDEMRDHIDSPPVPVAEGSPTCAKKSFETVKMDYFSSSQIALAI